jgi:tRNA A-37 threonylcarbamoyl transferase component Bud32
VPAESRIIRGELWGRHLIGLLSPTPPDVGAWMELHSKILKRSSDSLVGLLSVHDQLCYLKFYQSKSVVQKCLFRLGCGRAVRSFDMARELSGTGVAVPEPRACVALTGGMLLLTEGLPDSADLRSTWLESEDEEKRGQLMVAAAGALAKLHGAGFTHGDGKWSNFLLQGGKVTLVDLEAVSQCGPDRTGVARDLARFTVNAEDLAVAPNHYETFLAGYSESMQRPRDTLLEDMWVPLKRLRGRHLQKYGVRGHRLV